MSLFDCARCGISFPTEEVFVDHRREVHGIAPREHPATPQGSHEKNLAGHTEAEDVRRDPKRGRNTGGNRSVD